MTTTGATTVSIDAGLRGCGVGVFTGSELTRALYVPNPERTARGTKAWRAMAMAVVAALTLSGALGTLVVERMETYGPRHQKGSQADLHELTGVTGALAYALPAVTNVDYLPKQWKGQVPKEIHHERARRVLSELEGQLLAQRLASIPTSYRHNAMDAVALALFAAGRLGRGGR